METECSVEKLKNVVALAEKMTGKMLTLPTLHNILITASGTTLKVRSTNLNVGIEMELPATVKTEGMLLVKGEVLGNVLSNLPESETVRLSAANENLTVASKKNTTTVKCFPFEEFPSLPVVEGEIFEIKAALLAEGIRSVQFCAATTDIKPEIASVFIYSEENTLYFVATDSFRLSEKKIKVKGAPDIQKILLPSKSIADALRVLESVGETVRVSYSKNQLSLSGKGIYFTTRLIDGGFPDYRLILPKETQTKVVLMKQELLSTLRLSTSFSDKFFQIEFLADPKQKTVTIQSKNNDVGSAVSAIDAVIEGQQIEVSFNLRYFLDVFPSLTGDSVAVSFTTPNKPIVVKSVQDEAFLYLLVPTTRG